MRPAPHLREPAPPLHSVLLRRAIGIVVNLPALRRVALRVALRYPGLVQRFKRHLKDVMLPAGPSLPALTAPGPSGPATRLGPPFKELILDELHRLDAPSGEGKA
ncbi:hypothetical protein ACSUZJ_04975 [Telluria sp. B2]